MKRKGQQRIRLKPKSVQRKFRHQKKMKPVCTPNISNRKLKSRKKRKEKKQRKESKEEKELKTYGEGKTQASDTKKRISLLVEIERVDQEWVKKNKKTVESGGLTPKLPSRILVNPTPGTPEQDQITAEELPCNLHWEAK